MSGMTNPAAPVPVPPKQPAPPSRNPLHRILVYGGLIAFGAAILFGVRWLNRKPDPAKAPPVVAAKTEKVVRGPIEFRVRVSGSTSARDFATIVAPIMRGRGSERSMDIVKLAPAGTMVRKGEVVAVLDPTRMKDRIDDEMDELREEQTKLNKRKVEQELDMENMLQNLRVAKSEYEKAMLDLKAQEVRTVVDQELLKLAAEEAEASYKELLRDVEQKKIAQKAELRIQEISYQLQKLDVERYNRDLERLTLTTPIDGLVVMMSQNRPGGDQMTYGEGDQVQPGQPFMKIVNPASMQVEGTINQAESSAFRIGQMATIGLDAFPGATYQGKVYAIGALAVAGGRNQQFYIRSVPVRVQVQNPDKRMIPDLSASADVLLARADNVIVAPAAALRQENGKNVVYVKSASGFERREVKVGLHNGTQAEIVEGLKEGDEVRVN
ncbi:MAG: efflux RND transporter periplasmic adaptor subunit [Bryobacteraceae bacterium]|nr:efflux RND transporter periplasmic adaptor subunit [Bryobacteraceae bacterium]